MAYDEEMAKMPQVIECLAFHASPMKEGNESVYIALGNHLLSMFPGCRRVYVLSCSNLMPDTDSKLRAMKLSVDPHYRFFPVDFLKEIGTFVGYSIDLSSFNRKGRVLF